jgi:dTDP-4-amino-4,6-dideoxygalactose transaminase
MADYRGRPLGSIGHLGAVSFHETKNIISGEGGALLVNDQHLAERAEIIREKGTNRSRFFRGEVEQYTWVDLGSSYLPSELVAAFLWAQMEEADEITRRRSALWDSYHQWFETPEAEGRLRRPVVPEHCNHNAHMYYLLLFGLGSRTRFIEKLKGVGIHAVFHYVPLHSSPAGVRFGRAEGELEVTSQTADRIVRLPLWLGLEEHLAVVIREIMQAL